MYESQKDEDETGLIGPITIIGCQLASDAVKKQGESASDRPTRQRWWGACLVCDVGITAVEMVRSCSMGWQRKGDPCVVGSRV